MVWLCEGEGAEAMSIRGTGKETTLLSDLSI